MNVFSIQQIFRRFQQANPQPTTELIYHSPFELLIAVILSAQATDISVNKATKKLFAVANTPKKILDLGEIGLKKYIKHIGLFNNKAKYILKTCDILIKQHGSSTSEDSIRIPATREALQALPGVGRKTANVILNTCFGNPVMAVDTHIFRVANRIGLAQGKTALSVENQLLKMIPTEFLQSAHHWLILHGRYTCTARNPHCADCLIQDLCEYPGKKAVFKNKEKY